MTKYFYQIPILVAHFIPVQKARFKKSWERPKYAAEGAVVKSFKSKGQEYELRIIGCTHLSPIQSPFKPHS
jgi:hypothetical protein